MCYMRGLLAVAVWSLFGVCPSTAVAWGPKGHDVAGKVADKYLSKKAREAIGELLDGHQFTSLADGRLMNWADTIKSSATFRRKFPKMNQWHFIDLDVDKPTDGFKLTEIGPDQDNVLGAVKHFAKILKDPDKPIEERRFALFFIAHFLTDIAQPLHCAERDGDKGGNSVRVQMEDDVHETNLHKVWDTELVEEAMGSLTVTDYATRLTNQLSSAQRKKLQEGSLEDWIMESHTLARNKVYQDKSHDLKKGNPPHKLSAAYVTAGTEIVEEQLTKGGVRLAKFLNDLFAE